MNPLNNNGWRSLVRAANSEAFRCVRESSVDDWLWWRTFHLEALSRRGGYHGANTGTHWRQKTIGQILAARHGGWREEFPKM
jgi:hypothetical protein